MSGALLPCRVAAARVLHEVIGRGAALDQPLEQALERVAARDQALLRQLCYGTLRQYFRLQGILDLLLLKPLKARDGDVHALLLCGLHQLLDMRTPDHAAISATVDACRGLGKPWATRLVNGVLRRCAREADRLQAGLAEEARLSHPAWLIAELQSCWPQHWQQVIAAGNSHPPLCLRVNRRRGNRARYLESLSEAGLAAAACTLAEDGIRLATPIDVKRLPGFATGQVSVQDEAAQLAAPLLCLEPGQRILDACCAPGGKTGHILELCSPIQLTAMDSSAGRLERVEQNLARLELEAELLVGDARRPAETLGSCRFDRILVDAPCSGTGVIRRHPDIKLLRRDADIRQFIALQLDILRGVWPLLVPGGSLLYVTCSVLPAENSGVIDQFMVEQADALSESLAVDWGLPLGTGRQLLPAIEGPDGLFFARLVKAPA